MAQYVMSHAQCRLDILNVDVDVVLHKTESECLLNCFLLFLTLFTSIVDRCHP